VEGRVGALLGDEVVFGEPGDLIFKPRNQWHTFWNDGDEPARLIEVISPAGFEHFFEELVDLPRDEEGLPDFEALAEIAERYGHEFDPEGTERIRAEFDLRYEPFRVEVAA
jgi:gentisate 1,2-dioxygenase